MKNRQLSLSDIQKDYISKEEFYQIAHICKETALWLIETGRVSAEKPKRKGFGYKIAKEEVERYLAIRSLLIQVPKIWSERTAASVP